MQQMQFHKTSRHCRYSICFIRTQQTPRSRSSSREVRPFEEFASVRQTVSIEGIETTLEQIMSFILPAFHVGQAILASYSALLSYTSIVKLQKYEEMSKKVASYSNTAEHQLHKTRTTMTSGALSTLCSLLSSIALAIVSPRNDRRQLFLLSVVNTAACAFAHVHIR
jgi:hypothetical protein